MALPSSTSATHQFSLSDLDVVCKTLENVISRSYGPQGQSTLLSTNTGHVALSSDGLTILSSLQLPHPLTKMIIAALNSFIKTNGDGCKTIVIWLSSLVGAVCKEADSFCSTGSRNSDSAFRSYLSRSLVSFLSVDFPMIMALFQQIVNDKLGVNMKNEVVDFSCLIKGILRISLKQCVPEEFLEFLLKTVLEFLISGCASVRDIQDLCLGFENYVFVLSYQKYNAQIMKGILLKSRFNTSVSQSLPLRSINFICMQCTLDGICIESEDSDEISTSTLEMNSPSSLINHRQLIVNKFLSSLKGCGISLIITMSKVPNSFIQACHNSNIAIADCVEPEDMLWLCHIHKRMPVNSIRNVIDPSNIMQASNCSKITLSQRDYINLTFDEAFSKHHKCLIICAPSEGVSYQLKVKLKRTMVLILRLIDSISVDSSLELNLSNFIAQSFSKVVLGKGYFEMCLCRCLEIYSKRNDISIETKSWCSRMKIMMHSGIQLLLRGGLNVLHSRSIDRKALLSHQFMQSLFEESSTSIEMRNSIETVGLEVVNVRTTSLYATLQLALQLFRIDGFIPVTGLPSKYEKQDDEEGDDDQNY